MNRDKKIKVSVCVMTYNQEKYIRQCLQSIVDQAVDFYYEIIVSDDCSNDKTKEIILEFNNKYPNIFKLHLHNKNIGAFKNFIYTHQQALGEYIAHIDGDDIMLPGKLQKQVKIMDENTNCSFSVHKMIIFDSKTDKPIGVRPNKIVKKITSANELISNYLFFSHSSKMYRASAENNFKNTNKEVIDFYKHIEHASTGNIIYIDEILGAYRSNSVGSLTSGNLQQICKLFDLTLDAFDRAKDLGVENTVVAKGKSNWLFGALIKITDFGESENLFKYLDAWIKEEKILGKKHRAIEYISIKNKSLIYKYFKSINKTRALFNLIKNKIKKPSKRKLNDFDLIINK